MLLNWMILYPGNIKMTTTKSRHEIAQNGSVTITEHQGYYFEEDYGMATGLHKLN